MFLETEPISLLRSNSRSTCLAPPTSRVLQPSNIINNKSMEDTITMATLTVLHPLVPLWAEEGGFPRLGATLELEGAMVCRSMLLLLPTDLEVWTRPPHR